MAVLAMPGWCARDNPKSNASDSAPVSGKRMSVKQLCMELIKNVPDLVTCDWEDSVNIIWRCEKFLFSYVRI